jgi:hypothetical protein
MRRRTRRIIQVTAGVFAVCSFVPGWMALSGGPSEIVGWRATFWEMVATGAVGDGENLLMLLCVLAVGAVLGLLLDWIARRLTVR